GRRANRREPESASPCVPPSFLCGCHGRGRAVVVKILPPRPLLNMRSVRNRCAVCQLFLLAPFGPPRPRNAGVRSSSIERMSAQAGFFPLFWRADPERVPNTSRPLSKAAVAALHPGVTGAPQTMSDQALLGRVATGDVAALRLVYEEHAPRALAIARRILRNVEEAEDIVQETF